MIIERFLYVLSEQNIVTWLKRGNVQTKKLDETEKLSQMEYPRKKT